LREEVFFKILNMKNITYILAFALGIATTQAQTIDREVVATAGETISNGIITLDQTVGDLAVTDITNGTTTLQQGFQQTRVELSIQLDAVAFLQGAGINPVVGEEDLMRDNLRAAALIPTTSPYDNSVVAMAAVFDVTGVDAIVDWVEVELRQGADNSNTTLTARVSAFLQRDGDIVGIDGSSSIEFEVPVGDYFIAIKHRNHLGVLTNNAMSLSNSTANLADFTANASFVKGGILATAALPNGELALVGGDANSDAQIQTLDANLLRPIIGTASSYNSLDVNMDAQFQSNDISLLITVNNGKGQQF
jgi:hypothetical protein